MLVKELIKVLLECNMEWDVRVESNIERGRGISYCGDCNLEVINNDNGEFVLFRVEGEEEDF